MCAFITPVYAGKAHTYCCLCGAPFTVLSYGSPNYDWLRRMSTLQIRIDSRFISALDNRYILPIQKIKTPVFPSLTCHHTHRNSKITNEDVAFQMDFRFLINNFHYYDNNDGGHSFPFHQSCRKIFCQALSTHKYVSSLAEAYLVLEQQYWRVAPVGEVLKWPHNYYGASVFQTPQWTRVRASKVSPWVLMSETGY